MDCADADDLGTVSTCIGQWTLWEKKVVSTVPYKEMSTIQKVTLYINSKEIQMGEVKCVHYKEVSLIGRCPQGQVPL